MVQNIENISAGNALLYAAQESPAMGCITNLDLAFHFSNQDVLLHALAASRTVEYRSIIVTIMCLRD